MFLKISVVMCLAGAALCAQERFDMTVRNDFFSGFTGNSEALERGMKACEETLAANPKHAEAMVWHGGGVFFLSGVAARAKDFVKAGDLYKRGLDEMAAAVALAPENVAVLIPQGAVLLTASHSIPGGTGQELLRTGLADYEKVYRLQAGYWDKLSGHAAGELLFGLAEGYQRLGDDARARQWFEKLALVKGDNGHLMQAQDYLGSSKLTGTTNCVGCHVK